MDPSLVEQAQGGDPAAMEEVLESVAPLVHRFGLQMCRHPDDAEEVVQDTLLSIARNLPTFEGRSSLSSWVFTLARTACNRMRRGSKNRPMEPESAAPEQVDQAPSPERLLSAKELGDRVSEALHGLAEADREVLLLRDVEGLTAREAAEVLGVSVAALKSRLHRARSALRTALRPLLEAPEPKPDEACPDVAALLSRKLEGELDARDCAAMEAHLDKCPACRAGCDALQRALAVCRASAEGGQPVPPAVEHAVRTAVRAWLDGKSA